MEQNTPPAQGKRHSLCFSASMLTPLAICDRLYREVQAILVVVKALPSDNVGPEYLN
jgi:hypothetical protein